MPLRCDRLSGARVGQRLWSAGVGGRRRSVPTPVEAASDRRENRMHLSSERKARLGERVLCPAENARKQAGSARWRDLEDPTLILSGQNDLELTVIDGAGDAPTAIAPDNRILGVTTALT